MVFTICENARGFFTSRPSLVIFMICLGFITIALVTFSYIVKVQEMSNLDDKEDWNTFLDKFLGINFCTVSEIGSAVNSLHSSSLASSYNEHVGQAVNTVMHLDEHLPSHNSTGDSVPQYGTSHSQLINVSVVLNLDLRSINNLFNVTKFLNISELVAILKGHHFGYKGGRADINCHMTFMIPPAPNQTLGCVGRGCDQRPVCLLLSAPADFFPPMIYPDKFELCQRKPSTGFDKILLQVQENGLRCNNLSTLTFQHSYDSSLAVMITMQDISSVNLHLAHTSYFMFVMMMTLFCYAIIKGWPVKFRVVCTICRDPED